jgi:5-methylcytosine-specific restriction endonuclease McrA
VFGEHRIRMDDCQFRAPEMRGLTKDQCVGCYLCGAPLSGYRRRWCSERCEDTWWTNHSWQYASARALHRDRATCQRCGHRAGQRVGEKIIRVEVNHKVPLVGRGYHAGCVHHLDGLEVLCHECHVVETRTQIRERKGMWRGSSGRYTS